MKEDIDYFIAHGADHVFEKPLDISLFDNMMLKYSGAMCLEDDKTAKIADVV